MTYFKKIDGLSSTKDTFHLSLTHLHIYLSSHRYNIYTTAYLSTCLICTQWVNNILLHCLVSCFLICLFKHLANLHSIVILYNSSSSNEYTIIYFISLLLIVTLLDSRFCPLLTITHHI